MTISIPGVYYYVLFSTTSPDGCKFFGIHRTDNPAHNQDGQPPTYIGNGPKLQAKARQFGIHALRYDVLKLDPSYDVIKGELEKILTPATLADPRCLNLPQPEINKKISEAMVGKSKSPEHKESISLAMLTNQNARKDVQDVQDMTWWHNTVTAEEIQLPSDEEGLTGFTEGRLPSELKKNFKKDRKHTMTDSDRAKLIKD